MNGKMNFIWQTQIHASPKTTIGDGWYFQSWSMFGDDAGTYLNKKGRPIPNMPKMSSDVACTIKYSIGKRQYNMNADDIANDV